MDERITLSKEQLEIVNRIKCVFEELKKENISFGVYLDRDGFHALDFINMNDIKEIVSDEDFLDWEDPRRECAYIDSQGRYVEPDDPAFNAEYIYYSPKNLVDMDIPHLEFDTPEDGYIAFLKES